MKKQMDFNYKISILERHQVSKIEYIEEDLVGYMIDVIAYEEFGRIKQNELWVLISGECIETQYTIEIESKMNLFRSEKCKRIIIKRYLSANDILKWNLADYQRARLAVFKRILKSQKYYLENGEIFKSKIEKLQLPPEYSMYTKILGFLVAAKINDDDALEYFNTTDKIQIIIQVPIELSQRKLVYEPEQVNKSLKNIENVIGSKSMEHVFKYIHSYCDCMFKLTTSMNYKYLYDRKYYLQIAELIKILNEKAL